MCKIDWMMIYSVFHFIDIVTTLLILISVHVSYLFIYFGGGGGGKKGVVSLKLEWLLSLVLLAMCSLHFFIYFFNLYLFSGCSTSNESNRMAKWKHTSS
jgi:hypothetical protein